MTADDTTLTPTSRAALAHYRKRAAECRRKRRKGSVDEAATWDALADELEAFAEARALDGQGELL